MKSSKQPQKPNFHTTQKDPWWQKETCVLPPFQRNFYKAFTVQFCSIFDCVGE